MSEPYKKKTLLDISDEILSLEKMIDNHDGDIEELEKDFNEFLKHAYDDLEGKLDGYCALITEVTARSDFRKEEAKRLTARAKTDDNKVKFLKERLKYFFIHHEFNSYQTPRYNITLAKNGGVLPMALDEAKVSAEYTKTIVVNSPDKESIRKALEAGVKLDFAQFGERGQNIRIK